METFLLSYPDPRLSKKEEKAVLFLEKFGKSLGLENN